MLDLLSVYVPEDRCQAMARGETLPEQMEGAALLADISGFTPLTEAMVHHYGPQRGAEELTSLLDRVYNALIQKLHRYQGSVIGFSGDAITCWLDRDDGQRAIAAALEMQAAMRQLLSVSFPTGETVSLTVKVAIAVGNGLRLLVGDPAIQVIDVMGGSVVEHLAVAAQLAHAGEIIVDAQTANRLEGILTISEQRGTPDNSLSFAVVTGISRPVKPVPWPEIPMNSLTEDMLRPWALPTVYDRLRQGHDQFLTELRPTVALFLHFSGIDYEHNPAAGRQLYVYIRWVQAILNRYEGVLLEVTLAEKGGYLYGTFGAPVVHEDDARRAVAAAVELNSPPESMAFLQPVRIGLSRGTMRTGPIGSTSRRTYGVLGDEVNVAARLMEAAAPGEIIISERVFKRVKGLFESSPLPSLRVKGKAEPIPVYSVTQAIQGSNRIPPMHSSLLVGRAAQRAQLDEKMITVTESGSSTVIIEGEAGIGKSRLLFDWLNSASEKKVQTFIGAGDAIEQSTPYHAWRSIFSQVFDWESLPKEREARYEHVLAQLQPLGQQERAPLLNVVLPIDLPDNELTLEMTGKVRADNTHELLVALLQRAASTHPLRIIIEDAHWLDSASWALAQAVVRQVQPVLLALVTRPLSESIPAEYQWFLEQPTTLRLQLDALPPEDTIQMVCQRLGVAELPEPVSALIIEKAQGHPFFSEELAYALRDSGILRVVDGQASVAPRVDLARLNLPETVEGVVTSRIDLLTPGQQLILKVASVIGIVFSHRVLEDIHPVETDHDRVSEYLERLQKLDITPLVSPPPELSYMFKHIITREVTYNLLLFAQRRQLHQAVAEWYEQAFAGDLSQFYPLLAHHWLIASENAHNNLATRKAIEYVEKSGEAALHNYANQEAVEYFNKLLKIVNLENAQSYDVSILRLALWEQQLGEAHNRLGHLDDCEEHFGRSLQYLGWPLPQGTSGLVGADRKSVV